MVAKNSFGAKFGRTSANRCMDLTEQQRKNLWGLVVGELENYYANAARLPVSPKLDKAAIRAYAEKYKNGQPASPEEAVKHVVDGLTNYAVHTSHPMYFGLYNPRPAFAGILADALTAGFNPQMAAWSHSPFAAEAEEYLIRELGKHFGYAENSIDGCFASGGAEANQTALLCALNHCFPGFAQKGVLGIGASPVLYCSEDAHHSVVKAAGSSGLGMEAVRNIATGPDLTIDMAQLEARIEADTRNGHRPFMIIASAGATGTGAVDPLAALAQTAKKHGCWLHADAAYGGALALDPAHKQLLAGIDLADSITFDVHKWLSMPMGAGTFVTRHPGLLSETFNTLADYMPKDAKGLGITDPYAHTLQWSRRFIGLKFYLSLLIYGWDGFAAIVRRQMATGRYLREELLRAGWQVYNRTELPVLCFGNAGFEADPQLAIDVSQKTVATGKAWLSVYRLKGINALRACVTNYQTGKPEVDRLLELLNGIA